MKGTNIKKTVIHQELEPGLTEPVLKENVGKAIRKRLPAARNFSKTFPGESLNEVLKFMNYMKS